MRYHRQAGWAAGGGRANGTDLAKPLARGRQLPVGLLSLVLQPPFVRVYGQPGLVGVAG
eukprot:COSAG01_NODE_16310_length_1247_cov_58.436850_1_plen_58_part_10